MPFEADSADWRDWRDATIQPIITSLERFTGSGLIGPMAYGRLETLRKDHLPSETPAVIQEYLGTLPEALQVDYWARLLVYIQTTFGDYEESKCIYLVYPEKLEGMIQEKRASLKRLAEKRPSVITLKRLGEKRLSGERPTQEGGELSPPPKRPSL